MYDDEKALALENSVINDPPEVTAKRYKELGEVPFTVKALGYAIRFRGPEMVKVLVEGGANFNYNVDEILYDADIVNCRRFLWKHPGDLPAVLFFYIFRKNILTKSGRSLWNTYISDKNGAKLPFLPIKERVRIAEYLCDHARETNFEPGDLLFYSIYNNGPDEFYSALKNKGITLSEEKKKYIKSRKFIHGFWMKDNSEIRRTVSALLPELDGKKPRLDNMTWKLIDKKINGPEMLRFVYESFDLSDVKKIGIVEEIIRFDQTGLLENALERGWLINPQKREQMIGFSVNNGKTECTALLLDYKNRCFDLAAERAKAERKTARRLNAEPDSALALSEFWSFKKRPDGTFYIKGYKGGSDNGKVTVPEKIDGIPVTAIAQNAFSPEARNCSDEHRENRRKITEIILPDPVTEIGEFAFFRCGSLAKIKLPEKLSDMPAGMLECTEISGLVISGNVKRIGSLAFMSCSALKTVTLCEGVEEIGSGAFFACRDLEKIEIPRSVNKIDLQDNYNPFTRCGKLTAAVYKGSYAERFCKENNVPFEYIDDQNKEE